MAKEVKNSQIYAVNKLSDLIKETLSSSTQMNLIILHASIVKTPYCWEASL